MTSLTWYDESFSSQPVWTHYVSIIRPLTPQITDQAFLFVGVGNQTNPPPPPDGLFIELLTSFTQETGAVAIMISQIPNQPITFPDDPRQLERSEDDIIAYTWRKYMEAPEPKDPNVNLFFPMTKAVVRGMDAATEFCQSQDSTIQLDKFIIGGPSKRGWTTYLVGAVDNRIVAMVPMVISLLNMVPNLHHHYKSLGGWAIAFKPYWDEGLTSRLDDPETVQLAQMCDPYVFIENMTMPKLQIKGGGDEFFMLDDTEFFWNDLRGTNFMWSLPNTNHYLIGWYQDILYNIETFFYGVHEGFEWPTFNYQMSSSSTGGNIQVHVTSGELVNVTSWYCTTLDATRRDYRWIVANPNNTNEGVLREIDWFEEGVEDLGGNNYRVHFDAPSDGTWIGFFITLNFQGPRGRNLQVTTEPNVIPDYFPFLDCSGAACGGDIV
eukprot:GHVU01130499.1.p1 GENE.GHVU01130499.1~~GHVU01130499.1.p1  ORF type:complete len:457 (-),score=45.84 GHVU01130499.1:53-1360(-)